MLLSKLSCAFAAAFLLAIAPASFASGQAEAGHGQADEFARLQALLAAGRNSEAESLATSLVRGIESSADADSLALADALFSYAKARTARGLWEHPLTKQAARRSLGIRSRHLPPGDVAIAEAEALVAQLSAVEDPEGALAHARRALEVFESQRVPNDTVLVTSYVDVGQLELLCGRPDAALDPLARALELRTGLFGAGDRRLVSILNSMANAHFNMGDLDLADRRLNQAMAILDQGGRDSEDQRGLLPIMIKVSLGLGDLSRAIALAQEAVQLGIAFGDTTEIIGASSNLGVILIQFEDYAGARRVLEPLLPMCERIYGPQHWRASAVRQTIGSACFAMGDTVVAMRMYREGEAALLVQPDPRGDARLALCITGQANVLQLQKRHAEARLACERGTRINDASTQPERITLATSRALMIRILESLGDDAGLDSVRNDLAALRERRNLGGSASGPVIAYWLARVDQRLGRGADAWSGALAADAGIRERLRFNLESLPDSRALQLARRRSYILDQVLEFAAADSSRWETAWDRLVRTRGLVRAGLARRRLPSELRADSALARLHGQWVAAQGRLARRMVADAASRADSSARLALRSTAERAEAEYARALHERGAQLVPADAGLPEVRSKLLPDEALVAFAEVEAYDATRSVVAFVARGDDSRVRRLELGRSDSLRAWIAPWRERLAVSPGTDSGSANRAEAECRRLGELVRRMTWDRLAPYLSGTRSVAVVADGPLVDLPWQALPVGARDYLAEHGPLVRMLDAERDLGASAPSAPKGTMLALGDPDFGLKSRPAPDAGLVAAGFTPRRIRPCAGSIPETFPPLPATRGEALAATRAWALQGGGATRLLLGAEATEAAFQQLAPGAAVVHLATHGLVAGGPCVQAGIHSRGVGGVVSLEPPSQARPASRPGPAEAGGAPDSPGTGRGVWLALAGADHAGDAARDDDDGILTSEEVVTLDLGATDWVVLSACHSALAESWTREGALGMRRAFALAGARSVIASQWSVEDAATAEWMGLLYQARGGGYVRAAAAIREACRRALAERRRTSRSTHPFYWAAFTATSD